MVAGLGELPPCGWTFPILFSGLTGRGQGSRSQAEPPWVVNTQPSECEPRE